MVVAITAVITAAGMAAITVTTNDEKPAEKSRPALSPAIDRQRGTTVALLR
jgi:hypothetical protein